MTRPARPSLCLSGAGAAAVRPLLRTEPEGGRATRSGEQPGRVGGPQGGANIPLDDLHTLTEFTAALKRLRGSRSYAQLDRAVNPRSGPGAVPVLASSKVSDLLNGRVAPKQETLVVYLTACGLDAAARRPWLSAWERVTTAHLPHADGAVRAGKARPRLLGVHAAIQVAGAQGEVPLYVLRDVDADLRSGLTVAHRGVGSCCWWVAPRSARRARCTRRCEPCCRNGGCCIPPMPRRSAHW